ncbi:hypothetical protein [Paenibacillus sp. LjRoot153]
MITCVVLFGGTIGKLIFGVRIVNASGRYPTTTINIQVLTPNG